MNMHEEMPQREDNVLAEEEKEDFANGGYHFDKLHDQNESVTGEKNDLATGEPIRNDGDVEDPHAIEEDDRQGMKKIREDLKDDITTKWLLENGYDELGNEKKKAA